MTEQPSTSDKGKASIKSFEGQALRAYKDSVGVWTIGCGLTNYDKGLPWKVQAGLVITQEEADKWFAKSLADNYEPDVRSALKNPTQAQFDAGVGFHFNTGAIKKATWPAALNRGDMPAVRTSILAWNKAGGVVLAGLTRRRKRELAMIETGDYGPEGELGRSPVEIKGDDAPVRSGGLAQPRPTLPTLPTSNAPTGPGMLRKGFKGDEVRQAQEWLKALVAPDLEVDGDFGDATETAVRKFQGSHPQLTVDGTIGPATRSALQSDMMRRTKQGTAAKFVAFSMLSAGAAAKAVGYDLALGIVAFTGVVVLGVGVYLGLRYKDEIAAQLNRLRGRTVS